MSLVPCEAMGRGRVRAVVVRELGLFAVVAAGYAAGSETAFRWFNADGVTASFFPAAGVTLAALALSEVRRWPIVLAAAASAELLMDASHGIGLVPALGYMTANLVEATVGASLLRRVTPSPTLGRSRDLGAFFLAAVLVGPAVGGVLGATANVSLHGGDDWPRFAAQWMIGDGLGVLVVGGAALGLRSPLPGKTTAGRIVELSALLVAGALVTGALFWLELLPLAFAALALLYWIALRAGTPGVALAGGAMAFVAAHATANGHTFWELLDVPASTGMVYLQLVIGMAIVTSLALAAEINEREQAMRHLGRSETARLEAQEHARRTTLLQRIAARAAGVARPVAVAQILADETIEAFGARSVVLVLDTRDEAPTIVGSGGYSAHDRERLAAIVRDGKRVPLTTALREGRVARFSTRAEGSAAFADLPLLPITFGAAIAVPLEVDGVTLGAVSWGFVEEREFDESFVQLVEAIASQTALALERARLSDIEHRFAAELQAAMLPEQPAGTAGVLVATRYVASDHGLRVGGDWYDVVDLAPGVVGVAVGDVVGRGLRASAAMGQLRSAANALAHAVESPAELLTRLDRFADGVAGARFSTACYARLDTGTGRLRYAAAAHLPPLLLTGDAAVFLEDGRSTPLCAADPGAVRAEAEVALPPGATLVFYTDGLVERSHEPLDLGLDRLAQAVIEARGLEPERMADRILEALIPGEEARDDAAVVVVQLAPTGDALVRRVPARPGELRKLRRDLRAWLAAHGIDDGTAADIVVASNEAVSNVVEHAYADATPNHVDLRAELRGETIAITISDSGSWRDHVPTTADRGRGIAIMRAFAATVEIETETRGTTVRQVFDAGPRRRELEPSADE